MEIIRLKQKPANETRNQMQISESKRKPRGSELNFISQIWKRRTSSTRKAKRKPKHAEKPERNLKTKQHSPKLRTAPFLRINREPFLKLYPSAAGRKERSGRRKNQKKSTFSHNEPIRHILRGEEENSNADVNHNREQRDSFRRIFVDRSQASQILFILHGFFFSFL